jgi:hypothetical protein
MAGFCDYYAPTHTQYTYFNDFNINYLDVSSQNKIGAYKFDDTSLNAGERMGVNGAAGNDIIGIVIGSNDSTSSYELISTSSVSSDDFRLNNKINHGTNEGTIYYGTTIFETRSVTDKSKYIEIRRQFINNASIAQSINEVGLYLTNNTAGLTNYNAMEKCVGRALTGAPIVLNNLQSVIIRIRFYFET